MGVRSFLARGWLTMRSMAVCMALCGAVTPAAHAQRIATWALPPCSVAPCDGRIGAIRALGPGGAALMRGASLAADRASPGLAQSDSLASHDTRAEEGAVIGGLAGAVAGGVLFAHFTHRDGAINSTTGTLGGAIVGAGLLGGMGALVGLLVGSAVSH